MEKAFFEVSIENYDNDTLISCIDAFPIRVKNALLRNKITNVAKLLELTPKDKIVLIGVGRKGRIMIDEFCLKFESCKITFSEAFPNTIV